MAIFRGDAVGMNGAAPAFTEAPSPYSFGVTVDGDLTQFTPQSASTEVVANGNGGTAVAPNNPTCNANDANCTTDGAYMSYDATKLYLGVGGQAGQGAGTWGGALLADMGTYVTVYLGNGTGEGTEIPPATYVPAALAGMAVLPVASTDVIIWQASGGNAPASVSALTWNGAAWANATYTPIVGYQSGAKVEFSIAISDLGGGANGPPNITMVGAVVTNVAEAGGAAIYETFPTSHNIAPPFLSTNFSDFVDASRQSCLGPAQQLHLF